MLCKIALAALALCIPASLAAADISLDTGEAYGPFTDAYYITDPVSGVVMSVGRAAERNGLHVDLRGPRSANGAWEIEYFCEPDSVLFVEDGGQPSTYYLAHLGWIDDTHVSPRQAVVESRHFPSLGTMADMLPAAVRPQNPRDLWINVRQDQRADEQAVTTTVTVRNAGATPKRIAYMYQDAAYMWFPDGDQAHVESYSLIATSQGYVERVNTLNTAITEPGFWQFHGTLNREHGVVAGVLSMRSGDIVGIAGEYHGVTATQIDGTGYLLGRTDAQLSDVAPGEFGPLANARFKNRFIALDFGEVAPGASESLNFRRIMTVLPADQRTNDGIAAWVRAQVQALYGES